MDKTLFLTLTIGACVIETIFTPFFLHYQRPGICLKSFICKMICASMFLSVGILAYFYTGNTSEFAKFLLIGLTSSWFGDMFLHMKQGSKITFGIGMVFFAAAHMLYLIAYSKATNLYFPERNFFTIPEILITIVIIVVFYFIYKGKGQINFASPIMLAFVIYGFILVTMFVKAVSFGTQYIMAGHSVTGGLCLASGGTLFFTSDMTLVLLMFNEKMKKNHRLKDYNIGSYFLGQTLLALSVLTIGLV